MCYKFSVFLCISTTIKNKDFIIGPICCSICIILDIMMQNDIWQQLYVQILDKIMITVIFTVTKLNVLQMKVHNNSGCLLHACYKRIRFSIKQISRIFHSFTALDWALVQVPNRVLLSRQPVINDHGSPKTYDQQMSCMSIYPFELNN